MGARATTPLAATLSALVLLAGGCGDDDNGDPGSSGADGERAARTSDGGSGADGRDVTTSSLSKPQFIKRAVKICRQTRKGALEELAAYLEENESEDLPPEELYADAFKAVLVPQIESEIAEVEALGAPAGDEEEIERILEAESEALGEFEEVERLGSTQDYEAIFAEVDAMIREYGIGTCVLGSGRSGTQVGS